jgi:lysophospholipase L1-like esterase
LTNFWGVKLRIAIPAIAALMTCNMLVLGFAGAARAEGAIAPAAAKADSGSSIFAKVPCITPKSISQFDVALPHTAQVLATKRPLKIVAIGSSSTAGAGASSDAFHYPDRLALELRQRYPASTIAVLNRGVNGEDAAGMMVRWQAAVMDEHPDLVIWQLGSNSVLRDEDTSPIPNQIHNAIAQVRTMGADVILVDPQYTPRMLAKSGTKDMVQLLGTVARSERVALFPRFDVMRRWHDDQALGFETFSIADGLHMNDWGYACFAHVLGDVIAQTVARTNGLDQHPLSAMLR